MDEWYEELDFEENPFSTNPSDYVKNLVARDDIIDELIYRVSSGSIVFVEGSAGSGKSSLLRAVIKRFRGRGKVIYINSDKFEKKLDVEELLVQRNGLIKGMFLKQKPSKMILLLDNVSELSYRNMERIKNYFDENFLHSVVFTGEDFAKVGFSDSLKQRLEGRVLKIPEMTTDQIVEMVRLRLDDSKFFPDELVAEIAKKFNNNPKAVLNACEEVSEFVVGADEDVVTEKHIKEVLGVALAKTSKDAVSNKEKSVKKSVESKTSEKDAAKKESEADIVDDNNSEDDNSEDKTEEELAAEDDSEGNSDESSKESPEENSDDELDDFFDDDSDKEDSDDDSDKKQVDSVDDDFDNEDDSKVSNDDSDDELDDFFDDDSDKDDSDKDNSNNDSEKKNVGSKSDAEDDTSEDLDEELEELFGDDSDDDDSDERDSVDEKSKKKSEDNSEKDSNEKSSEDEDSIDEKENVIEPIISDDEDDEEKKNVKEEDDFFEDSFFEDDEDEEVKEEDEESDNKKGEDSVFDDFFDDDLEEEK